MIEFQKRLLSLLSQETGDTASQTRAATYFADLNAALLLITSSWPQAATLLPHSPHIDAADTHVRNLRTTLTPPMRSTPLTTLLDALPRDAASCASLLAVADQMLALPDLETHLARLAAHARMRPAALIKLARLHEPCSQPVRAAIEPWTAVLDQSPYSGRPNFPRLGEQAIGFERRHVPQKLPDRWLTGFAGCQNLHHDIPRRAAAAALVQLAAGGSHPSAADYLGMSPGTSHALTSAGSRWKTIDRHAQEFLDALRHVVALLNNPDNQIDYKNRRDQLRYWEIPDRDWQHITVVVNQCLATSRNQPKWDEQKRLAATIVTWTRITEGEPRSAPARNRALESGPLGPSISSLIKTLLTPSTDRPTHFSTHLRAVLIDYANELAAAIDAAAHDRHPPTP